MQLHDVTGKVQQARLIVAVQSARCASCRAGRAFKFKKTINLEIQKKQTSLSGEHDFPGQGCNTPCLGAQEIPLVRGMG